MSKPISSQPEGQTHRQTENPSQPVAEHALPLHTPGTASLLLAACIATIAWLALAAQTDITVHRMLARGLSVFDGFERLSSSLFFVCRRAWPLVARAIFSQATGGDGSRGVYRVCRTGV
jgi:hypothetical protein